MQMSQIRIKVLTSPTSGRAPETLSCNGITQYPNDVECIRIFNAPDNAKLFVAGRFLLISKASRVEGSYGSYIKITDNTQVIHICNSG